MKTQTFARSNLLASSLVGLVAVFGSYLAFHPHLVRAAWNRQSADHALIAAAMSQSEGTSIQDTADMKIALEQGANVNVQSSKGVTALIHCASYGNVEGVKLLLAHHADVNIKTWGGDTALAAAKQEKSTPIVRLLQQAGAKE